MTAEERRSPENGLWLCANCATEIDKDPERFPVSLLRQWKSEAEEEALRLLAHSSYRLLGIPRPAFAPPLEYQRRALQQIIDHLRQSGISTVSLPQLAQLLADPSLRDGLNPIFEPLSVEAIAGAIDEFIESGELVWSGQSFIVPS